VALAFASLIPLGSVKPTAIDAVFGRLDVSVRKLNEPSLLFGNVWLAAMLLNSTPAFSTCEPAKLSMLNVARSTKRVCVSWRMSGNPAVPNTTPG
jgi:hypothetical protein